MLTVAGRGSVLDPLMALRYVMYLWFMADVMFSHEHPNYDVCMRIFISGESMHNGPNYCIDSNQISLNDKDRQSNIVGCANLRIASTEGKICYL